MHGTGIIGRQYGNALLIYNVTRIDLMFEKESSYTGLLVTVDDGPVDWGGSAY